MKQKLLFTMMLAFLAACFSTQAQSLYVAGQEVTSTGNVTGSWLEGGSVYYDASTKTLTLDNAVIGATGGKAGITSYIYGLTIQVTGTCNVTNNGNAAGILINSPATITGGGTLKSVSSNDCGIFMNKTSLTISDCTVDAKGKWGIAGYDGTSGEHLTISNATVTAQGDGSHGTLCDLASLTLNGCNITQPAGAAYDESLHAVALGGAIVTGQVVISKAETFPNNPVSNEVVALPFTETFEKDSPNLSKWYGFDRDEDGHNWFLCTNHNWGDSDTPPPAHDGEDMAMSASYINGTGALTPDNWIVSPILASGKNRELTFYMCAQDGNFPAEHYAVYVIDGSADVDAFIASPGAAVFEETFDASAGAKPATVSRSPRKTQSAWQKKTVDLSSYTGRIRIAFRHYNSTDQFMLNLDGINVTGTMTGIKELDNNSKELDSRMYDLQGRRILTPVKGQLYIKGGKKYVAK